MDKLANQLTNFTTSETSDNIKIHQESLDPLLSTDEGVNDDDLTTGAIDGSSTTMSTNSLSTHSNSSSVTSGSANNDEAEKNEDSWSSSDRSWSGSDEEAPNQQNDEEDEDNVYDDEGLPKDVEFEDSTLGPGARYCSGRSTDHTKFVINTH